MSIVLAKILGLYLLGIGIAFLVSPTNFKRMLVVAKKDEGFQFLGGIFGLLIGAVIVSIHNFWVLGWPVIITILGWWSLIKGLALLVYPKFIDLFSFMQNKSDNYYRVFSLIYIILGLFLVYKAFL